MADAVAEEYKSSLADLNFNSKPHINMLTMLADDNIKYAPQIVQAIVDHIQTVPAEVKLPGLYLVDSIIKNVGKQYLTLFSQNLVALFSCVFEKVEENTRSLLYKLRQTWNDILPNKILYAVDVRVKKLDPAWPVTAQPPAQSIHINPKFLDSNSQNQPDIAVVKKEDALLKEQTGVLKQLLEKQEHLRQGQERVKQLEQERLRQERDKKLEQKKQEIAKCINNVKLNAAARSFAISNSKISHRDPRLQKANILSLSKSIENAVLSESIKVSQSAPNIPSIAIVPKPKEILTKPNEVANPKEVLTKLKEVIPKPKEVISKPKEIISKPKEVISKPKEVLLKPNEVLPDPVAEPLPVVQNSKPNKNVALLKDPVKNADPSPKSVASSPKKSSFKRNEGQTHSVRNSPSDKSKNHSHKSHLSPNKKQDELCVKAQEHKPDLSNEIHNSPKRVQKNSKEAEKSPRSSSRKRSLSPDGKSKSSSRYSRNQSKSETFKKNSRPRSRSPIHKSEIFKPKSDASADSEKRGRRHGSVDKELENSEKTTKNSEINSRDQVGRGRGKRESSVSKDEEGKENETAPPEKKVKEEMPDDHSERSQDSHNLFGKEDQDYRQITKNPNQTTHHKGWAQYKESHPDEFKSPLRPVRNSMENKSHFPEKFSNRSYPNMGPSDGFCPPEYDRLGRLRLHRGRMDQRFTCRRGYFSRGPSNRFEPFHLIEQSPQSFPDPQYILQETETRYRLGRITESEYLDLKRDLEVVLRTDEFRRLRDSTYRIQGPPERFRMQGQRDFGNRPILGDKPPIQGPRFNGEPLRIQGPRLPPPEVRSFKLDNKMRMIHFVDEKALVIMDNDEPRELTFKGDRRQVFIEGLPDPISLGFEGETAEFEVAGKRHIMRFGAPSREIYIDNHPYEAKFGGGPFAAMLEENRLFRIRLSGPPPQVVVGDTPQFELFSKFHIKSAAPPMKPIENPDVHRRPDQSTGNLPFDVDMRMNADNDIRKPVDNFDPQSGDMKDIDWRHVPPSKTSEEIGYFKSVHQQPEHWDKNVPLPNNRNFIERNPQNHPDWKNNDQYSSDRPPAIPKEWESMQPPPFPCPKLNGSPHNTPPHDKEWDHFEGQNRREWRENEHRQDMSAPPPSLLPHPDQRHIQRNSPINMEDNLPQYHDQEIDVMRPKMHPPLRPPFNEQPQMRLRAPVPQYGTWQRPNFRERVPMTQGMPRTLLPPPLPPFQMKPSLLGDGPRPVLEPPPALPDLGPVESLPEKVLKATTVPVTVDSSGMLTSESTASATATPSIDVGSLFQKLVAAGIIHSKEPNLEKDEIKVKEERSKEKDSNKEKEPDIEPVPHIELKLESLRKHHSGVISALYRGSQCATCGMRFKEIQSDHYKRHLDWHFRMNRREKDGVKKAFSRRWYYEVEDWYQFEEFEDFEERAPSYFELQADGTQILTEEPIDVPSVPASGQETEVCVVCDETFQLFWVEEEEEWHLRDAVRHEEQAYHPACYEDHKKASEIPATPVEEKILVKEELAKETDETTVEVSNTTEEIIIKKEEVEPMDAEDTDAAKEETELNTVVEDLSESIAEVKVKEEPPEDILEGKPGEEEVIGLISESEVEPESEEPKEEPKMVVQSGGGIVLKIKAESMQPQSPATQVVTEKDESSKAAEESEEEEEFRPPTPDPRFQILPPVKRGTELSGLCSIM